MINAVAIRPAAGHHLSALFFRHFLFAHVRAHVAFRLRRTIKTEESWLVLGRTMAVSFEVGDTFSSYKDLKNRVEEFEKINFVQLAHRDSGTLAAAAKRAPKVVEKANKELVYYSIVLTCVLGGKKHKCEGSGVRPTQK